MGSDISDVDLLNIKYFSERVDNLIKYREKLSNYLKDKTQNLAPNTSALVGETVTARLISHSGSLSTLAKYPASTIQILGAEKALFRALKTRSATPKYGLLYHSSFIGKAKMKNKGKISRYLANKLAMCSRIDAFSKDISNDYGNELRNQIDERLKYLDTGDKPRKNIDVMKKVQNQLLNKKRAKPEKEEKKDKMEESSDDEESKSEEVKEKKKQKKVSDKKNKKKKEESDEEMEKESKSDSEEKEKNRIKKKKKSIKKEVENSDDDE